MVLDNRLLIISHYKGRKCCKYLYFTSSLCAKLTSSWLLVSSFLETLHAITQSRRGSFVGTSTRALCLRASFLQFTQGPIVLRLVYQSSVVQLWSFVSATIKQDTAPSSKSKSKPRQNTQYQSAAAKWLQKRAIVRDRSALFKAQNPEKWPAAAFCLEGINCGWASIALF